MLSGTQDILEFFRGLPVPVCLLLFVPFVLLTSSISPVYGMQEFPVFRLHQYDMHGSKYGSRSASVNSEARPISSNNVVRRCAVAKMSEVDMSKLKLKIGEGLNALLVLLPQNLQEISEEDRIYYQQLEVQFLDTEIPIPVYFAFENEDLLDLYAKISASVSSDSASSAAKALTTVASANAYHFVSSASDPKQLTDFPIISLQGKLSGQGLEDQLPTIALVAHYDSSGMIPKLARGPDANGSGVVALFELARLFSRLYSHSGTHAKYNIIFFLSGGGKFNYQGTRKFIDESLETSEISLLSEIDYVLCLDALGRGNRLNFHVSKPPKEGSTAYEIFQEMKSLIAQVYPEVAFKMVHKKINLADEMLAWEHERFSIRRLPAGTISHYESPDDLDRSTVFFKSVDREVLTRNIKIIGEVLARHIFNLTSKTSPTNLEILSGSLDPDKGIISTWLDQVSEETRCAYLVTKESPFLKAAEEILSTYLKDVKRSLTRADKKDPEFVFYDGFEAKMSVYSVKPALFDLLLAVFIALYLVAVYFVVESFHGSFCLLAMRGFYESIKYPGQAFENMMFGYMNFPLIIDLLPKSNANGKCHQN